MSHAAPADRHAHPHVAVDPALHPPRRTRGWVAIGLIGLLLALAGVALQQAWQDAPTADEPTYIAAGVTALTWHDLRMNPQHPPLGKALAALPVLLARPSIPSGPSWQHGLQHPFTRDLVLALKNRGQLREVVFLARIVPVAELLACTFCVFLLGTRLTGPAGGLCAVGLWAVDPFVVGLGHLDGIDLPFTLATLLTVLATWRLLEIPSAARALGLGATVGAACSSGRPGRCSGWPQSVR